MITQAVKLCFVFQLPRARSCSLIAIVTLALLIGLVDSRALADQPRKATVVCFGDSITNRGYYEPLGKLLNVETINAGVGGHSSAMGLRRIKKDVLDHQPDVVVVLFGTNDMRVDSPRVYVPVTKYRKNLEAIVDACAEIDAHVVLCTPPPIEAATYFTRHKKEDFEKLGGLEKALQDYGAAVQEVAEQHELPMVDLNAILTDEPNWMSKDGVHPSPKGNSILARHIAGAVAPLLPK